MFSMHFVGTDQCSHCFRPGPRNTSSHWREAPAALHKQKFSLESRVSRIVYTLVKRECWDRGGRISIGRHRHGCRQSAPTGYAFRYIPCVSKSCTAVAALQDRARSRAVRRQCRIIFSRSELSGGCPTQGFPSGRSRESRASDGPQMCHNGARTVHNSDVVDVRSIIRGCHVVRNLACREVAVKDHSPQSCLVCCSSEIHRAGCIRGSEPYRASLRLNIGSSRKLGAIIRGRRCRS